MSSRALDLAVRRGQLIERSAQLRRRLAEDSRGVARLCAAADRAADGVSTVRAHPEWVFGGVLALVALKPRRLWKWGRMAVIGWRAWAGLRQRFPGAFPPARP